ncbi:MAG: stage II sporulation protein M [Candidatus Diapherotrites archaeon]|nr:stage II sporulation protein M [Candidatus Micrarchaeota archaeon]MBU1939902.1 stage II sporulation protein M [Candidatus Micrarchaeota archaeon]
MVLESIFSAAMAKKHSVLMFILGALLSTAGIWTSYYIFPQYTGVLAIAFVTIGATPIIHKIILLETEVESCTPGWAIGFLARHFCIVKVYAWLTIGLIASFSFWYAVLPIAVPAHCPNGGIECMVPVRGTVFLEQEKTFSAITGQATGGIGMAECKNPETRDFGKCFTLIFENNAIVLGLAILFSFIYGAGAIFLIGWNASVIGVFIGKEVLDVHILAGIMRGIGYLPHGIFELGGYFVGAIAGGIISVAATRGGFTSAGFRRIAKDTLFLLLIAYGLLLIGAAVEVWLIMG